MPELAQASCCWTRQRGLTCFATAYRSLLQRRTHRQDLEADVGAQLRHQAPDVPGRRLVQTPARVEVLVGTVVQQHWLHRHPRRKATDTEPACARPRGCTWRLHGRRGSWAHTPLVGSPLQVAGKVGGIVAQLGAGCVPQQTVPWLGGALRGNHEAAVTS